MNRYDKYLVPSDSRILKQVCDSVAPGESLDHTMRTMEAVCKKGSTKGAGLAAPQVGVDKRLVYINCGAGKGYFMFNPVITWQSPHSQIAVERCLSYPGKEKAIARPTAIDVEYETVQRRPIKARVLFFHARVVCHEIDHLDGICRVGDDSPADSLSPLSPPPGICGKFLARRSSDADQHGRGR